MHEAENVKMKGKNGTFGEKLELLQVCLFELANSFLLIRTKIPCNLGI